jgi:hypothetical protein
MPMIRVTKLAALAGALAILTAGPGCGVFDEYLDDDVYSTEYRPAVPPPVPAAGVQQPAEVAPGVLPAYPGVYADGEQR